MEVATPRAVFLFLLSRSLPSKIERENICTAETVTSPQRTGRFVLVLLPITFCTYVECRDELTTDVSSRHSLCLRWLFESACTADTETLDLEMFIKSDAPEYVRKHSNCPIVTRAGIGCAPVRGAHRGLGSWSYRYWYYFYEYECGLLYRKFHRSYTAISLVGLHGTGVRVHPGNWYSDTRV